MPWVVTALAMSMTDFVPVAPCAHRRQSNPALPAPNWNWRLDAILARHLAPGVCVCVCVCMCDVHVVSAAQCQGEKGAEAWEKDKRRCGIMLAPCAGAHANPLEPPEPVGPKTQALALACGRSGILIRAVMFSASLSLHVCVRARVCLCACVCVCAFSFSSVPFLNQRANALDCCAPALLLN